MNPARARFAPDLRVKGPPRLDPAGATLSATRPGVAAMGRGHQVEAIAGQFRRPLDGRRVVIPAYAPRALQRCGSRRAPFLARAPLAPGLRPEGLVQLDLTGAAIMAAARSGDSCATGSTW